MSNNYSISANDPILNTLPFRPYETLVERRFEPFEPQAGEPKTIEILTPWGETLTAAAGDLILHEVGSPEDRWPVKKEIFNETYTVTRPGHCCKSVVTMLTPLTNLTGDENADVTVHSLEGEYTVRAGDFFLARGIRGEIWAMPKEKVLANMKLLNDA